MNKYTPGPWRVAGLNIGSANEKVVASCYQDSPESVVVRPESVEECLANARLCASAPDLLEACKLLQAALTEYHLRDVKKRYSLCVADAAASKAIARATGTDSEGRE